MLQIYQTVIQVQQILRAYETRKSQPLCRCPSIDSDQVNGDEKRMWSPCLNKDGVISFVERVAKTFFTL